ncbi:hypothetical protein BYT27DRAFT_6548729 [Phlegmacium glaucopus]|nr:hypothetical protein BYT27DRAFT_6548729 [Phlegmacium glaucopus]
MFRHEHLWNHHLDLLMFKPKILSLAPLSFSTYPTFCACLEFFIPTSLALSISSFLFSILRRLTHYQIKLSMHHLQTSSNSIFCPSTPQTRSLTSLLCIKRNCHFGYISLNAMTPDGSVIGTLAKQLK